MARPSKKGIDYFNIDVNFLEDTKVQKLLIKEGTMGVLVYIYSLALIYRDGYYLEIDLTDLADIIATHLLLREEKDKNAVLKCLETILEINLFDKLTYEFDKVITSKRIQEHFYSVTLRRKKTDRPYWLLSAAEMENLTRYYKQKAEINVDRNVYVDNNSDLVNVDKNPISGDINPQNDELLQTETGLLQTKVHKVKVKEKVKEDKEDKYDKRNCPFHLDYFTSCLINDHLIDVYHIDIHRFISLFCELLEDNDFSLVERCFRYTRDYCRKHKTEIYDIYSFFAYALKENIRKMDGYEERMENYYAELDAYLSSIRNDSEDE